MLTTFEQFKTFYKALEQKMKSLKVKSNWNQNDPTADDYIKNRTHYSEIGEIFLLPETQFNSDVNEIILNDVLVEGQTYIVTWNGIDYECVAREYDGYIMIGNNAIYEYDGGIDTDSGEPFAMETSGGSLELWVYSNDETAVFSIKITQEIIHKIDEKYLPQSIGAKSTGKNAEIFNDYDNNEASGEYSHAEGLETIADGLGSHAEGSHTTASRDSTHAEGSGTIASGYTAHAEGSGTTASGDYSHTEGRSTRASNLAAHAEGYNTRASGSYSHAEGNYTLASSLNQHVQGKYNIEDTANKYAHIVGNGTSTSARSNAHTIDWNGNAWFAGDIKVGGTGQDDVNAKSISDLVDIGLATSTNDGLMSSTDKTKLDNLQLATSTNDGLMSSTDKVKVDSIILNPTDILVSNIYMRDQVNGKTYAVQMRNGSLVSIFVPTLTITANPTKMTYYDGDYLDTEGMVLTLTYEDGTTKEITEGITTTSVSMSNNVATIEYIENGITSSTTLEVTVVEFDPAIVLVDFNYTDNGDGTYTITGWKQTLNGVASTEMVVPNNSRIIL